MASATRLIRRTAQFKRDANRSKRRGKDLGKLRGVVAALASGSPLDKRLRDHALAGAYRGARVCHVEPDWLLIYEVSDDELILIRTGTRSDLFKL